MTSPTLTTAIGELRTEIRGEVPDRLHASHVPKLLNDDGTTDRDSADEGGLGLPLTARMHRFIGHWSHWGQSRLGTLSIMEVSDWCHARHTGHSLPGRTRSLCALMLHHVARGVEPKDLAAEEGLAYLHSLRPDHLELMLMAALNHAAHWRTGQEHRSKDVRFDGPEPLPYEPLRRSGLTLEVNRA